MKTVKYSGELYSASFNYEKGMYNLRRRRRKERAYLTPQAKMRLERISELLKKPQVQVLSEAVEFYYRNNPLVRELETNEFASMMNSIPQFLVDPKTGMLSWEKL